MTRADEYLTTGLGLGKLPWVPGTWASLPPVVLYQVLGYLAPLAIVPTMAVFLLVGAWTSLVYGSIARPTAAQAKPVSFVADVLAGQALTMLLIALLRPANICNSMALGFALYRLFDIAQPWPCQRLRRQPGGIGILADDLMAGAYAGTVAIGVLTMVPAVCR